MQVPRFSLLVVRMFDEEVPTRISGFLAWNLSSFHSANAQRHLKHIYLPPRRRIISSRIEVGPLADIQVLSLIISSLN
jgi:hypothetical protein